MSCGTCPHRCLIGLGHDRTFVLIHRTLLSHEANRLPFQSRLKRRYKLESRFPGDTAQAAPKAGKRPKDQIVQMRRGHINYAAALGGVEKHGNHRVQ
jgi:hypothetical protein